MEGSLVSKEPSIFCVIDRSVNIVNCRFISSWFFSWRLSSLLLFSSLLFLPLLCHLLLAFNQIIFRVKFTKTACIKKILLKKYTEKPKNSYIFLSTKRLIILDKIFLCFLLYGLIDEFLCRKERLYCSAARLTLFILAIPGLLPMLPAKSSRTRFISFRLNALH